VPAHSSTPKLNQSSQLSEPVCRAKLTLAARALGFAPSDQVDWEARIEEHRSSPLPGSFHVRGCPDNSCHHRYVLAIHVRTAYGPCQWLRCKRQRRRRSQHESRGGTFNRWCRFNRQLDQFFRAPICNGVRGCPAWNRGHRLLVRNIRNGSHILWCGINIERGQWFYWQLHLRRDCGRIRLFCTSALLFLGWQSGSEHSSDV